MYLNRLNVSWSLIIKFNSVKLCFLLSMLLIQKKIYYDYILKKKLI